MALEFSSGLMVMDLALSLLWCKFDPLLRDFCMLWTQTKKKKKKRKERKKDGFFLVFFLSSSGAQFQVSDYL